MGPDRGPRRLPSTLCDLSIFILLLIFATGAAALESSTAAPAAGGAPDSAVAAAAEQSLADQVRAVLAHYQQDDPVGLPAAPVPDPMDIPDMKQSFSVATMNFKGVRVYGLSRFRLEHVRSDLTAMQMSVGLSIATLDIRGRYTMSALWTRSAGRFNVTLTDVYVAGVGRLDVERSGKLQAQEINLDITFGDILMEFENLGFMGNIFQGIVNSVGTFLFDSIKPFILKEVNNNVRGDVNKQVEKYPHTFPNSVSPLDKALADVRTLVRERGYDPHHLPNYNYTTGLFTVYLTHMWVTGLATVYREGDVVALISDHVFYGAAHVATQRLGARCQWELNVAGLVSRAGTLSFTIEYLQVLVNVSQPLDTRQRPRLERLDLKLGNIQARMDGAGSLDYVVEFVVNVAPNLLRYQIVNAIEGPLRKKIQKVLDEVDVAQIIENKLPEIEQELVSNGLT